MAFNFNGDTLTISSPIGIGSILTAELFAIRAALTKLQSLVLDGRLLSFRRVLLFSDCQIAIEIINGNVHPTGDFELVSAIKTLAKSLRPKIQVDILWVPAHVGVRGNELADDAAKTGAYAVAENYPLPGQPPISLSTSVGLARMT